jgi:hypothetical protein
MARACYEGSAWSIHVPVDIRRTHVLVCGALGREASPRTWW